MLASRRTSQAASVAWPEDSECSDNGVVLRAQNLTREAHQQQRRHPQQPRAILQLAQDPESYGSARSGTAGVGQAPRQAPQRTTWAGTSTDGERQSTPTCVPNHAPERAS